MCGLWASVGLVVGPAVIERVAHRGPDGAGWREFAAPAGRVVLAHRRLAITDLAPRGLQPMTSQDGARWIVFNGAIYNHLELRAALSARGHHFATTTDTEVILAAFAEWGAACLERLNGMFAFVIYDESETRLFAARDRFGIKPLYLARHERGIAFASEIKQILALRDFAARLNRARARDFLSAGVLDHTGETMFDGIGQLRGGECLTLDLSTTLDASASHRWPPPRRWYSLPDAAAPRAHADGADAVRACLEESVRLQLRADVPIGSCLSGGIDSAAIVGIASQQLRDVGAAGMRTVSAVFDDPAIDERRFVDLVAAEHPIDARRISPSADDLYGALDRVVWHQDEPFGSMSMVAQWAVFEAAARHGLKVMLDGQGADEMFAGYRTQLGAYLAGFTAQGHFDPAGALRAASALRRRTGLRWRRLAALLLAASMPPALFGASAALAGKPACPRWLARRPGERPATIQIHFRASRTRAETPLDALCRAALTTRSLPALLHAEDRNSMAHGIEARVPYLDHRLVERAVHLTDVERISGGWTKRTLRRAVSGHVPAEVRDRTDKLGFATPETAWLRGPLRAVANEAIEDAIRRFPDVLVAPVLRRHAAAMLDGRRALDFSLWRVIALGAWGRVFGVSI